jgi:hypothetical protein
VNIIQRVAAQAFPPTLSDLSRTSAAEIYSADSNPSSAEESDWESDESAAEETSEAPNLLIDAETDYATFHTS